MISNVVTIEFFDNVDIDENSSISHRLCPEKQAISVSVIAKLLESDTLDKSVK